MKAALAKENPDSQLLGEAVCCCGDGSLRVAAVEPCKPETRIAHAKIRMARDCMRN